MHIDQYVGRIVRIKKYAFRDITRVSSRRKADIENCFLVARVNRAMRELICYGEDRRITVSVKDVVLI